MNDVIHVDIEPEFEPLITEASNLMLAAKSHQAKDEAVDAAIAHTDAGRALSELATRLLQGNYAQEAVEEVLRAAECFLEACDSNKAQRQLERFQTLPELTEALNSDARLTREHRRIRLATAKLANAFNRAFDELRDQMGSSRGAKKLKLAWLEQALATFPGVAAFHFFAAQRHWSIGERTTSRTSQARSIEHLRWCVRLTPDSPNLQILLCFHLEEAQRWKEAFAVADEAAQRFSNVAMIRACNGWVRFFHVFNSNGPKELLATAIKEFRQALHLANQLTPDQVATVRLSLAACLDKTGKTKEATKFLKEAVGGPPVEVSDLALKALRAKNSTARIRALRNYAPQIVQNLRPDVTCTESMLAGIA